MTSTVFPSQATSSMWLSLSSASLLNLYVPGCSGIALLLKRRFAELSNTQFLVQ